MILDNKVTKASFGFSSVLAWLAPILLVGCLVTATSCIEIQQILSDQPGSGNNNSGSADTPVDSSPNDNTNSGGIIPTVSLTISNPTPQINEEVFLTCVVQTGLEANLSFAFQPAGRLFVNTSTGRASLIIEASDIGSSFSFTCTATNSQGTSEPSPSRLITPT